eukprot:SAG31_NODE_1213_length_9359_cov_4.298164_12_plen_212_part_00
MWLPVANSFSRNQTAAAIKKGKYANIRVMAGGSGSPVYADAKSGRVLTASDYGNGTCAEVPGRGNSTQVKCTSSNPWMTAKMSVAVGHSAASGGDYPLFEVGATCWYFAQRLSELGVDVPIGIANTAIGGQRIEEYMSNASINTCAKRSSGPPHSPGRDWDARHFADMISPFLDMTVKGWTWYRMLSLYLIPPTSPPPASLRQFLSSSFFL